MEQKPVFEKRIFWDVNFENIDYDAEANFVIERVFDMGDVQDIRNCRRYYGDEKVTEVLLIASFSDFKKYSLASAIISKPLSEFLNYSIAKKKYVLENKNKIFIEHHLNPIYHFPSQTLLPPLNQGLQ